MQKIANYLLITKNGEEYTIAMTEELQEEVGTVGFAEITEDDVVEVNDAIVNLEASKTVMEIASPLAGKISARNEAAINSPELLSSEKPEDNWIVKLVDVDEAAFNALGTE